MNNQNMSTTALIPAEHIEQLILLIRGQKVMLDSHLAELYGVTTKTLNQAVRRNIARFPGDFMFQLSMKELESLQSMRSQIVTASKRNVRYLPYVFTEQGVAMLSSVLRSQRAIQVNIAIMRAFVKLRELLSTHKELAQKLEELEMKYDENFRVVFDVIRKLMEPSLPRKRRKIGFKLR